MFCLNMREKKKDKEATSSRRKRREEVMKEEEAYDTQTFCHISAGPVRRPIESGRLSVLVMWPNLCDQHASKEFEGEQALTFILSS